MLSMAKRNNTLDGRAARERFLLTCGGRCHYCNVELTLETLYIDHKIPFSVVRCNKIQNFVPCCKECNDAKGTFVGADYDEICAEIARVRGTTVSAMWHDIYSEAEVAELRQTVVQSKVLAEAQLRAKEAVDRLFPPDGKYEQ
jgi:hypothetical protein